jgi:hypothetical protein
MQRSCGTVSAARGRPPHRAIKRPMITMCEKLWTDEYLTDKSTCGQAPNGLCVHVWGHSNPTLRAREQLEILLST